MVVGWVDAGNPTPSGVSLGLLGFATQPTIASISAYFSAIPTYRRYCTSTIQDRSGIVPDRTSMSQDCPGIIPDCLGIVADCVGIIPDCSGIVPNHTSMSQDRSGIVPDRTSMSQDWVGMSPECRGIMLDCSGIILDCAAMMQDRSGIVSDCFLFAPERLGAIAAYVAAYIGWVDAGNPTSNTHPQTDLNTSLMANSNIKSNTDLCSPIDGITSISDISMKTGIHPIFWCGYQSMAYWIVMDVIHMLNKILFILNLMFPKTTLPNCLFSLMNS